MNQNLSCKGQVVVLQKKRVLISSRSQNSVVSAMPVAVLLITNHIQVFFGLTTTKKHQLNGRIGIDDQWPPKSTSMSTELATLPTDIGRTVK